MQLMDELVPFFSPFWRPWQHNVVAGAELLLPFEDDI